MRPKNTAYCESWTKVNIQLFPGIFGTKEISKHSSTMWKVSYIIEVKILFNVQLIRLCLGTKTTNVNFINLSISLIITLLNETKTKVDLKIQIK